jgi:hypothetical protein
MRGFAVIDLETTGLAYNRMDRVCDVRLLVDPDGRREHAWTTLINPNATWARGCCAQQHVRRRVLGRCGE